MPLLNGEDRRVAFCAVNKDGRPEHLLRALLEGLTLEIDAALKRASRAAEIELEGLTLLGGGAKNALWRQLKADASGLCARTVADPECVARGAAMLAGIEAAVFEDHGSVPTPGHDPDIHRPSGERAIYERLYSEVHEPLRRQLELTYSAWQEVGGATKPSGA